MKRINLLPVPNQSITFDANDTRFKLRIFCGNDAMLFDLDINGERVFSGFRIVFQQPLIPFDYLARHGNFLIHCDECEEINWRKFGNGQELYYGEPQN